MARRRRRSREQDLERELRSHLDAEARERQESGLPEDEARFAAMRAFGNVTRVKEGTREMWGWTALERFWQDSRYAARTLRMSPGFTAVTVVMLALGIGANTAIFSLLNAVVLRQLPVADPQQLVQFTYTIPKTGPNNWNSYFGYPQFERFKEQSKTLAGVFARTSLGRLNVGLHGSAELAQGDSYTGNTFELLGVTPERGRFFGTSDDRADASVTVLSDRYWRNRFGGDPSIVGSTVTINQLPFTVIGIAKPEFSGITLGIGPDLWLPLHVLDRLKPDAKRWTESFTSWLLVAGRLKPGIDLQQAQAELDTLHHRLLAEQLAASDRRDSENMQRFVRESRLVLRPAETGMYSGLRETYSFPLRVLMWVAGIVLLVSCANVANLLLARACHRRREIAVRLALGAGRGRLVRQVLTESMLLAFLSGLLAFGIARWGSSALVRMISAADAPALDAHPDWRVFGFAAGVSLLTGILFGLAPALRGTRVAPGPSIKEDSGRSRRSLDRGLVMIQVALSMVLLAGAGLFLRTLQKLWSVEMGYDRENVLMFSVDGKLAAYPKGRAGVVYREILDRMRSLSGVRSASASIVRPIDDSFDLIDRINEVDGRQLSDRDAISVSWNAVAPGYFATVSTPILAGRDFDARDQENSAKVVMVNEALATRLLAGENPIGHRLAGATIVGIVKNSHYGGVREQPRLVLYRCFFQTEPSWAFASFELRHRAGIDLLSEVRREVAAVDRNLPLFRLNTLRAQTEQSLLKERLLARLSTFFGALALLLACLGLYGLMAYAVARRTNEIGIRMALGARSEQVTWLVLKETLYLVLGGIAAGFPLTLWLTRYTKSLLFGIEAGDPLTICVTIGALIGAALLAGYMPARRAVRVDPMVALRYE